MYSFPLARTTYSRSSWPGSIEAVSSGCQGRAMPSVFPVFMAGLH